MEVKESCFSGCSTKETRIRLSGLPVKEENREVRPRKEDRRPGRPSKNRKPPTTPPEEISDDEIDISYLLAQQKDLFRPPVFGMCIFLLILLSF